jgi:hypothetical protein
VSAYWPSISSTAKSTVIAARAMAARTPKSSILQLFGPGHRHRNVTKRQALMCRTVRDGRQYAP